MTAKDLADVVAGVSPVIREFYAAQMATVVAEMKVQQGALLDVISGLEQRIAATEQRGMTPGPIGPPGPAGPPGEPGPAGAVGRDGIDGKDGESGAAGERGDIGPMGLTGPKGIDGLNGKDGADGLPGKDGAPGVDGQKGLDGAPGRDGRDGIQGLPGTNGIDGKDGAAGLNGKDGANGLDGLGFDDMEPVYDEQGRLSVRFVRGDQVKAFRVPGHVYCDVYRPEKAYEVGDTATYGGSLWVAKAASAGKQPDTTLGAAFWQLACKRGRDGKPGIEGKAGRPGRDLTKPEEPKW